MPAEVIFVPDSDPWYNKDTGARHAAGHDPSDLAVYRILYGHPSFRDFLHQYRGAGERRDRRRDGIPEGHLYHAASDQEYRSRLRDALYCGQYESLRQHLRHDGRRPGQCVHGYGHVRISGILRTEQHGIRQLYFRCDLRSVPDCHRRITVPDQLYYEREGGVTYGCKLWPDS